MEPATYTHIATEALRIMLAALATMVISGTVWIIAWDTLPPEWGDRKPTKSELVTVKVARTVCIASVIILWIAILVLIFTVKR